MKYYCEKCKKVVEKYMYIDVEIGRPGRGWSNADKRIYDEMCEDCAKELLNKIKDAINV